MKVQTNLRQMKSRRRAPAAGDLFVMQLPTEKYLFGRVVLATPPRPFAPMPESYLVYVYAVQSDTPQIEHQTLTVDKLLLPPIWTNRLGWTKSYFRVIGNEALNSSNTLAKHCFKRHDGIYLDGRGARLSKRIEPCGEWGLASYRWIDDHVSDALNIPRVPIQTTDHQYAARKRK